MLRITLAAVAATLTLTLAACGGSTSTSGEADGPTVVVTTTQVGDFTRSVAGDRATVVQILDPNTDAHDFEPSSDDAKAVASADLVIVNGIGLDGWMTDLHRSSGSNATIVVATEGIMPRAGDDGSPDGDPHVWMDPRHARTMVNRIADALAEADPDDADAYRAAAAEYEGRIAALDTELEKLVSSVPADRRRIVTDHDAFGYLTEHYRIRSIGTIIPSISTGAEPNAKDMTALAQTVRREGVRVIFPEAALDPALARSLATDAGATVGPELYADSLGPADGPAGTYLDMMRHNVSAMVDGMRAG